LILDTVLASFSFGVNKGSPFFLLIPQVHNPEVGAFRSVVTGYGAGTSTGELSGNTVEADCQYSESGICGEIHVCICVCMCVHNYLFACLCAFILEVLDSVSNLL
jgi:hypothetical protein